MTKKKPLDLVAPSRIGDDEGDYLSALIATKQQADQTLNAFTAYLAQKYALSEGDGLRPDGTIQRKATP